MEYVNIETGEITFDAYESVPVNIYEMFKNEYYVNPNTATNDVMLREQCLSVGEKQVCEPYINIELYRQILKKDYSVVLKLIDKIKYRNIVFIGINYLCDVFGLSDNKNLDRKLKALAKRNIIQYSKVSRSQYKLFVNPKIFYRGDKRSYIVLCNKQEWIVDGKPQTPKELIVEYDFSVSDANEEKELVWTIEDERVKKILEELGYKHEDDYEKCVGLIRKNKVLNCNMQEFITKYIN